MPPNESNIEEQPCSNQLSNLTAPPTSENMNLNGLQPVEGQAAGTKPSFLKFEKLGNTDSQGVKNNSSLLQRFASDDFFKKALALATPTVHSPAQIPNKKVLI